MARTGSSYESGKPEPAMQDAETRERVEARLRSKMHEWLTKSFDDFLDAERLPIEGDVFDSTDFILRELECPFPEGDHRFTSTQLERVRLFFDELYEFVRERRRDVKLRKHVGAYLHAWYESAFAVSPNIFNCMSLQDEIVVAARFFRLPEARASLGTNTTGELVYGLAFMSGGREAFLRRAFDGATPEARLDLLHYLVEVGKNALGQDWAENAGVDVRRFLARLESDSEQSPFVHYVARASSEALAAYHEFASGEIEEGVFEDDEDDSTWRDEMTRENLAIGTRVVAKPISLAEPVMRRISRDAIAGFDATLTPQTIAWSTEHMELRRDNVPVSFDIVQLLEALKSPASRHPQRLQRIVAFADERIFSILPKSHWITYWNSQKNHPSDPEFEAKLVYELGRILQELQYTELNFLLFEDVASAERIKRAGVGEGLDTSLLLQEIHRPEIREAIERDMGISLADLSLREQIQLLAYLVRVDAKTAIEGFAAIQDYGLDAARAFLSCEYGKEYGDAIVKIGKVLDHATAVKIFKTYANIIDVTDITAEELQRSFLSDSSKPIDVHSVQEQLIERGRSIIHSAAQRIAQAKDPVVAAEVLQQELERFRSDVVLFAAVFREATKGSKTAEFKEWKGVSLETVDPQMLGTIERKRLFEGCRDVLLANWAEKGIDASAIALHGLEEGFEKKTNRTRLHLLRRNESILAFVRFDERPDLGTNALYAGSFNVDPAARGSSIGSAFFHETLKTEGKDHDIRAHVFVDDRVGTSYVEEFGFVITGVERDQATDGSTTDWFTIRRDESLNRRLATKAVEAPVGRVFYLPDDREAMMDYVREETSKGNVITRYRSRKDGKREVRELTSESMTVLRKTPRAPRTAHAEVPPG